MATFSASAPGPIHPYDLREFRPGDRDRHSDQPGSARMLFGSLAAFAGNRRLALAAALVVGGAVLESVGILLIVPILQLLLAPQAGTEPTTGTPIARLLEPIGAPAQPAVLMALFAVLMLLRAAVLVARDTQLIRLQWGFIEAIKLDLLRRLACASWKDIMAVERPRLNRALGSDMMQVGMAVNASLQTAAAALMMAAYCSFAVIVAPGLSLVTFVILATVGLLGATYVRRARAFGRAVLGYDLRVEESATHFLAGLKLAKAQDLEAGFVATYAAASGRAVDTRVAFGRSVSTSRQLAALIGAAAAAAAVLTAVLSSRIDPPSLVTLIVLLVRTGAPVAQIQQGVQHVANALPTFADLQDLGTRLPPASVGHDKGRLARAANRSPCPISLVSVRLTHRTADGEPRGGIGATDLDIEPGEFLGLGGPTGSGKSTLLDVVAGLERPDAGTIRLDGREPTESEWATHRRSLAYLGADPVLFGGTLRSNLAWAAPDASEAAMREALAMAGADDLVERLGGGLGSPIHEGGANLSAGERQQLALARAFLRKPSLLLLDEATCSLDRDLERRVLARLAARDPRPTILFTSHRAESFSLCDRVLTLEDGRIASIRRAA